ncbi:MAG: hypothetical protein JW798_09050 [Prolixibacteraceae bacterium]|nr:hypothetical protein [Prolixibacteraceae bacterium]
MNKFLPLIFLCLIFITKSQAQTILYVDHSATGNNDGTSWTNAYTSLQTALDNASSNYQIWVGAGTYYPSVEVGGTGDRFKAFQMKNGVAIYGGFTGKETSISERSNYGNGEANETILSGDLNMDDIFDAANGGYQSNTGSDNCYHVFHHPNGLGLDNTALLDGFTVSGGNAFNGSSIYEGGGMSNYTSSPQITNCCFTSNHAYHGAAISNRFNSSPTIVNCVFKSNNSSDIGGGIYNLFSSPFLSNCDFYSNWAYYSGGGIYNYSSSPIINSCSFNANTASHSDGGGHL